MIHTTTIQGAAKPRRAMAGPGGAASDSILATAMWPIASTVKNQYAPFSSGLANHRLGGLETCQISEASHLT